MPGVCKPLVKCVRFFHEIQEVSDRPCTLKTGETGVCCPYFNVPKKPSKCALVGGVFPYLCPSKSSKYSLVFCYFSGLGNFLM